MIVRKRYGPEGVRERELKEFGKTSRRSAEGKERLRWSKREAQRTPGWNVLRLTHDLCERPRPSPRPRMSISRRMNARRLRRICLRPRPKQAHPWGSQRSENVRLAVVMSSPGPSLLREIGWSATGLRKMLFFGWEV
jgi:hypothetical protein